MFFFHLAILRYRTASGRPTISFTKPLGEGPISVAKLAHMFSRYEPAFRSPSGGSISLEQKKPVQFCLSRPEER